MMLHVGFYGNVAGQERWDSMWSTSMQRDNS